MAWTAHTAWAPRQGAPTPSDGATPCSPPPLRDGVGAAFPIRAVWWALLGLLVGEVLGGILGVAVMVAADVTATSAPVVLAGEVGLWAGMIGACVLVSRRYGTGSLRRDLLLSFRPVDLLIGPGGTLVGLLVTAVLAQPFVGTRFAGSNTQIISGQPHHSPGFVLVSLIATVGAPIFEELFFRGLIRTALASRIGAKPAVLAQAGLFGLAHINVSSGVGNVEVVVVITGFGIVLGLLAHTTRRLAPGMVAHGLYNLVVTLTILGG